MAVEASSGWSRMLAGIGAVRRRAYLDRHWWWAGLGLIGVVALVLRIAIILAAPHFKAMGDAADYERHAAYIATGHGYPPTQIASPGTPSAFRPPAYPYLLGALYALAGVHPNLGRLLGAGLGVVTVWLVAWLGAELWDRRIGLVAGTIAAVCPTLIALNSTLLSESLFLPLELATAIAILALRRSRAPVRTAMMTGALCGIAALTRTVGIVWLLPSVLAALTARRPRSDRVRAVLALLASCVVVLIPWAIRNANAFHAFIPLNTEGGFTLVGQYNVESGRDNKLQAVVRIPSQVPSLTRSLAPLYRRPGGVNEAQLDSRLLHDALGYISHHPSHVPIAVGLDALRMFNLGKNHQFTTATAYDGMSLPHSLWNVTTIFIQVITLIAILGLICRVTRRLPRPLGPLLAWAVPLLAIASTVVTGGNPRYRVPADPFLILLAAFTIVEVAKRVGRSSRVETS